MDDHPTAHESPSVEERWLPRASATSCLALLRGVQRIRNEVSQGGGLHPLAPVTTARPKKAARSKSKSVIGTDAEPGYSDDDLSHRRFVQWSADISWLRKRLPELLESLALTGEWGLIREVALDELPPVIFNDWRPLENEAHRCLEEGLSELEERLTIAARERELALNWEPQYATLLPEHPIKTVAHLRKWLSEWLEKIYSPECSLDDIHRELRNSRRLIRELSISLPSSLDHDPTDLHDAERRLADLIDSLKRWHSVGPPALAEPKTNRPAIASSGGEKIVGETPPRAALKSDRTPRGDLPCNIAEALQRKQFTVMAYLWKQTRSVTMDTLRKQCWSTNVQRETVLKTVRRAEESLVEAGIFHVHVECSETKDTVRLIVDDQADPGHQ